MHHDDSRNITFLHLEALVALADTGSFSRAAQRLRHVQEQCGR